MKFLKALSVMAMAIFFAPMVHAGSVSVKVSDLLFTVQDLAPEDGVTPSFEILDGQWTTAAGYSRWDTPPLPDINLPAWKDGYLKDTLLGDVNGFVKISSAGLEVSNSVAGVDYNYNFNAQVGGDYPGALRLSPNSLLMLSFKLEMTAEAECPIAASYCESAGHFNVGFSTPGFNVDAHYAKSVFGSARSGSFSDVIYVPFANSSQEYVDLIVGMTLSGHNVSSGVPEPSLFLCMGAGLAICGWQLRTRKLASS